jgi:hypothetical protein
VDLERPDFFAHVYFPDLSLPRAWQL